MISVSEKANTELRKVMASDVAREKGLVIFFQGFG